MFSYGANVLQKIYDRVSSRLHMFTEKLCFNEGLQHEDMRVLMQECRILFFSKFEDYYEDDDQYCNFLYICMRNRLRNMKRSEYVRGKHIVDIASICCDQDIEYQQTWGNVPDPRSIKEKPAFDIEIVMSVVSGTAQEIIDGIILGKSIKKIASEMNMKQREVEGILRGEIKEAVNFHSDTQ